MRNLELILGDKLVEVNPENVKKHLIETVKMYKGANLTVTIKDKRLNKEIISWLFVNNQNVLLEFQNNIVRTLKDYADFNTLENFELTISTDGTEIGCYYFASKEFFKMYGRAIRLNVAQELVRLGGGTEMIKKYALASVNLNYEATQLGALMQLLATKMKVPNQTLAKKTVAAKKTAKKTETAKA